MTAGDISSLETPFLGGVSHVKTTMYLILSMASIWALLNPRGEQEWARCLAEDKCWTGRAVWTVGLLLIILGLGDDDIHHTRAWKDGRNVASLIEFCLAPLWMNYQTKSGS
jgi:hypothetical protein